jgi:heme-degrading monooxygenase HmoA
MILEQAVLDVRPGQEAEFERAFAEAQSIIASMPGYLGHRLLRCVEQQSRYLLLAEWETLEHHTEGFRGSPEYQRWRELLHHFYDPFPTVEHYEVVALEPS